MRLALLATSVVLLMVTAAFGQPASRFEAGPAIRLERVFIEGDARGDTVVAGVFTSFRMSKRYGLEGELTGASNRIDRSYQSWFISYAQGPNATRDEIERLAPIARRTLGYVPGLGGSVAFVARGAVSRRVSVAGRAGVSVRRYTETSAITILSIPEGVDAARAARDLQGLNSSDGRTRGGLLLGLDVPVAATDRLSVAPEFRFVYGGPARIGYKHRELGIGARGTWRF